MTAKEQAQEIVNMFIPFSDGEHSGTIELAKQCALIHVREIQKLQVNHPQNWGSSGMALKFLELEIEKL